METFEDYLAKLENAEHRARLEEIFHWIAETFPRLQPKVAWNQPMFTDHGTFIIAFSSAKKHLAASPERSAIQYFSHEIHRAGYEHSLELIRFPWDRPVDFDLLARIIDYNIREKKDCSTFWRK